MHSPHNILHLVWLGQSIASIHNLAHVYLGSSCLDHIYIPKTGLGVLYKIYGSRGGSLVA